MTHKPETRTTWNSPTPAGIALIIFVALAMLRIFVFRPEMTAGSQAMEVATVRYVIDGDTVDLTDGRRVRLQGIDAPEMGFDGSDPEPYAQESTTWLRDRIEGKRVQLRIDSPKPDRYKRTLAWIFDDKGQHINLEMLREGQAKLLDDFGLPQDLESSLRDAYAEARELKRGMWETKSRKKP